MQREVIESLIKTKAKYLFHLPIPFQFDKKNLLNFTIDLLFKNRQMIRISFFVVL